MSTNKIEYSRGDKSLQEKFRKTAGLLQISLSCRKDFTPLQSPQGDIIASSWGMSKSITESIYEACHETQTQ